MDLSPKCIFQFTGCTSKCSLMPLWKCSLVALRGLEIFHFYLHGAFLTDEHCFAFSSHTEKGLLCWAGQVQGQQPPGDEHRWARGDPPSQDPGKGTPALGLHQVASPFTAWSVNVCGSSPLQCPHAMCPSGNAEILAAPMQVAAISAIVTCHRSPLWFSHSLIES